MATDHKDIERAIIKGVTGIIAQVTGVTDKILNSINQELTSKDFLSEYKLASSSVINSLKELMKDDFIEKKMEKYQLVDPLLKTVIKHRV